MQIFWDARAGFDGALALASLCALGVDANDLAGRLGAANCPLHLALTPLADEIEPALSLALAPCEKGGITPGPLQGLREKLAGSIEALHLRPARAARLMRLLPRLGALEQGEADEACLWLVACAAALDMLGVEEVVATPLPVCNMPLQAAAILGPCKYAPGLAGAQVSLGGALCYAGLVDLVREDLSGVLAGYGVGASPAFAPAPLRSIRVRAALFRQENVRVPHAIGGREDVLQLETHIDHLTAEEVGLALDALSKSEGVLDVLWLTGIGKKGRPMGMLRLLCREQDEERVGRLLFRHTHTLGYRRLRLERVVLPRGLRKSKQGLAAKGYCLEGCLYERAESDAIAIWAQSRKVGAPAYRLGIKE